MAIYIFEGTHNPKLDTTSVHVTRHLMSLNCVISLFVRSFLFVVLQLQCNTTNKTFVDELFVHEHAVTSPHCKLAHQKDQAVNHSIEVFCIIIIVRYIKEE